MNNVYVQNLYQVLQNPALTGADRLAVQDAIRVLDAITPVGECYAMKPEQISDGDFASHMFHKMESELMEAIVKAGLVETEKVENKAYNELIFRMSLNVLDVKRARNSKLIPDFVRFPRGLDEVATIKKEEQADV